MRKLIFVLLMIGVSGLALAVNPPEATASPASKAPAAAVAKTAGKAGPAAAADWRPKWDTTIAEAKKEGSLVVYAGSIGEAGRALAQAFKDKFGITLELVQGRGEEIVARINSERKAGIYGVDVGLPGMSWYFNSIKPMAITLPIQPLLILPEVLDTSKWREHRLPIGDKAGHLAVILLGAQPHLSMNSDVVKAGEITSLSDLLQPKWRGKIVMNDPSVGGAGSEVFTFTVREVMGLEKGTAFMKALAGQEPVIIRDLRLMTEWIARGRYPLGWGPDPAPTAEFIRSGAHLTIPTLKEPRATTSATCNIMVLDKAPHPNAARLFANWLLSKEGATVFSKSYGYPSTRLDVPTEGIDPGLLLGPNEVILGEDYQLAKGEMRKLAADIFRSRIK